MARFRLTTRLTTFFLGALALVLVGFSTATDLLARSGLSRQADERLASALATLTAAVEIHPEGLEWEPNERLVALGQEPEADEVRWTVHDDSGRLVDRSVNLGSPALLGRFAVPVNANVQVVRRVRLDGRPWRVLRRRLGPVQGPTRGGLPQSLVLTTALCLEPLEATVGRLDRVLAGVSLAVWLLAAALGRGLARRALDPLRRMAQAARGQGPSGFGLRLPSPGTGDELQDLADAFNGLLDRLHEAFDRQARFTGDASHQLRTPLAAMLGQVDVTLRRDRPADDYRRTLTLVRAQAQNLNRIIEMLLFLARADAEAVLPDREVVDLIAWTREHVRGWSGHPRVADLTFETSSDAAVWAAVHPQLLGQLVDNLLDNAFKYSSPGSPVRVRVGRSGSQLALSVEDRGSGIAAEDRPHIFDPFYRSPRARAEGRPGVGLGLTVAQRIAQALDGHLSAQEFPGGGSVLTLTLPAARQFEPAQALAVSPL